MVHEETFLSTKLVLPINDCFLRDWKKRYSGQPIPSAQEMNEFSPETVNGLSVCVPVVHKGDKGHGYTLSRCIARVHHPGYATQFVTSCTDEASQVDKFLQWFCNREGFSDQLWRSRRRSGCHPHTSRDPFSSLHQGRT